MSRTTIYNGVVLVCHVAPPVPVVVVVVVVPVTEALRVDPFSRHHAGIDTHAHLSFRCA